jgi:hypothetical protein
VIIPISILAFIIMLQGLVIYRLSKRLDSVDTRLEDHNISILRLNHRTSGRTKSVQGVAKGLPDKFLS